MARLLVRTVAKQFQISYPIQLFVFKLSHLIGSRPAGLVLRGLSATFPRRGWWVTYTFFFEDTFKIILLTESRSPSVAIEEDKDGFELEDGKKQYSAVYYIENGERG